jgi:hypothetical protein
MKLMVRSLPSTQLPDAPAWLGDVYAARRQRTTDLVRISIDALEKDGTPVSITSVVAVSRHFDPSRKGISESALLRNPDARALYDQHRTWKGTRRRRSTPQSRKPEPIRVKPGRNRGRAGQRYMRQTKGELVARLLVAEHACCEFEDKWLRTADELFAWMLVVGALFRTADTDAAPATNFYASTTPGLARGYGQGQAKS